MNLKITLALLVLVGAGAALWLFGPSLPPQLDPVPRPAPVVDAGTRATLEMLRPEALTRVEVRRGDRVTVLERAPGGAWTMPGQWPTREAEVKALVELLGGLHSRFEPLPIAGDEDPGEQAAALEEYGLAPPGVTVKVETEKQKYRLDFGERPEKAGEARSNRFSRETYVRVGDLPEVVRLGPGIVAALDRPADYYQQRRLFPADRVAKEAGSQEKIARLNAQKVVADDKKEGGQHYGLARRKDNGAWELTDPVRDRLDARARDALLQAVPDVWAEQFVVAADAKTGLDQPERTLAVTGPDGNTITLLIGKPSQTRAKKVMRPPPPGLPPGIPPREETVHEEYRYARLKDNNQVFEIKADKLKDVFVPLGTLRDAQVARFNADDARRLEVRHAGHEIVLAKDKEGDRWKLLQPLQADADRDKVRDLLTRLSGLEARDKDVLDKADPKAYGLDKPATEIKVTVEEEDKEAKADPSKEKKKTTRTLTVKLGKHDAGAKKLYVQADDWPRINAVEDGLVKLADRTALDYRGKRLFDFAASDLEKIDVHRGGQAVTLQQGKDGWRLTAPVAAEADTVKVGQMATTLAGLEALEYVNDKPPAEALDKEYGLEKPALSVALTLKDKDKSKARTLQLGKARGAKPGFFAKLADAPAVFAVGNDVHGLLDRDSLAYLRPQLWQVPAEEITGLRIKRSGQDEYRLTRDKDRASWQVTGPFTAAALPAVAQALTNELASPQAESYKAHEAKDLAPYGLDKPFLEATVTAKDGKDHTLLIGSPVVKDGQARFAKQADSPAIFVVGEALVRAADRDALALLDPVLLNVDTTRLQRIHAKAGDEAWTLERKDKEWRVVDTPGAPFAPDAEALSSLQGVWLNLRAERFADFGPKVDLAKYGLDKPAVTVTATLAGEAGAKGAEHTVELGGDADKGGRYARLDKGAGVAVLSPETAGALARTRLDLVERTVLKLDAGAVTALQRHMGPDVLEVAKKEDGWHLAKPEEQRADDKAVQDLLGRLADLRASKIAAYPARDLERFGLDLPAALVTIKLAPDKKPAEHILKLGKVADEASGDRYAVVDGGQVVAVLPGAVARRLVAGPLAFRDRGLARFADADRVRLERGPRKALFARVDGNWKLTEPLAADADQDELDDFINSLAKLRADELVGEKPGADDLKKYGLDRPEARWTLHLGDKDVLQLLVGKREKEGPRCYARLAGRDLVFLLDARLSEKVLGELRTRTVWAAPLDAVQIESLRYDYPRNPFVLEKGEGDAWQVVNKPDAKVSKEAVNETLAALSGLKLARFAVDKDADLKLFGLEQPELVLEVLTRSGKRVLHLGHTEGESKRRYARIPEAGRSDVFILSEADSARIMRDLPAFTRTPPAPRPAPTP